MKCPRCESENPPIAMFCDECGARLESPCPNCGEPNRHGAKFCRNCGQAVSQAAKSAPSTGPGVPPPDAYVPKYLAEKILASRHKLEGERKHVTVLFADIRGSTKLLETVDPEEAQKILDPVLRIMMDTVHRYEGTVNQVLGDGIMALFGAPLAHEDHALRACYAALAMQEEMRGYRAKLGQSDLQIGVGINSGEVVLRSIDNDLNIDYSAIGHTTNLAARMEELADGGAILMTVSTLREIEGFVQVKLIGAVQAKGVSRAIDAYELVGATAARTRVQAAAVRGLTPLVGRKTEVEVFTKLVEQTTAGRGQVLALVGEAGMGKSRLVHEFSRHQLPPGWFALEAAAVSYGKATPYFPLVEMLRRYFEIADGDGPESILDKVVVHLLELDKALKSTIPAALFLLGALPGDKEPFPVVQPSWLSELSDIRDSIKRFNDMDPQQRRRYSLDALRRVLIRESQRQPLLAIFEDLHWVDSETEAFLDGFIESLPMARVLLLIDYRPEFKHDWGDKTYYTQIRIEPLPLSGAGELLQHLLGNNPDLEPLKEMLTKRTEGNPFFAEESVRSLVESRFVTGEKGAYRPGLKIDSVHIPSTVQNVVADRIDHLPIEEKHLLQTAAVIGVIVPLPLLRAVSGLPDHELFQYLSKLQFAEFFYETNLFPEIEYTFKHALTNEVAYGALLHERRTFLHARTAKALEEMKEHTSHDHVEKLAHHSLHGELWDKAVTYLKEAGFKAVSRSSFRDAVFRFEQALEALGHLSSTQDTLRNAVDLRVEIRNALFILGEYHRGLPYLEKAKTDALALNDHGRLGLVLTLMTAHWNLAGDSERAIASAKQALHHTAGPQYIDLHIASRYFLGAAYHSVGEYAEATTIFEQTLGLIGNRKTEQFGTTGSLYVICRAWLVRCLAQIGKFSDALPIADEATHVAIENGHEYTVVYAYYGVGLLRLLRGEFTAAVAAFERGLEVCQAADLPVHYPLVASSLGVACAFVGRSDDAFRLLRSAVEHPAWASRLGGQPLRMVWVADGYLQLGRADEAQAFAQRGFELSIKGKDRGSQAWLWRILGDLSAMRDPLCVNEAEDCYKKALALAQELEMRPLQAHCHLGLGQTYSRVGIADRAHFEFHAAIDLYRAMLMPFWMSKAESDLEKFR